MKCWKTAAKEQKNKNIKTLYELQNFEADDSAITALNINQNGYLLGVGFQTGKIKIYEIMNYLYQKYKLNYCIKNLHEYLNFINEKFNESGIFTNLLP